MVLQKTLQNITAICKDKHAYLRSCCTFVTAELEKDATLDNMSPEERANMLFYPLKIAAETRDESFVVLAVDGIQKLVVHGVIDGSFVYKSPDVPQPPKKKGFSLFGGGETPPTQTPKNEREEQTPLIQVVLGVVCMNANIPQDEVQLLVVRALLAAVSVARCEVHGSSLLLCIRTACDIFLQAKALPAQTSAKAALSQMIGTVQQKLEREEMSPISEEESCSVAADETGSCGSCGDAASEKGDEVLDFASANERDCFLLIRSLCKLSSKPCDGLVDSVEMRSKVLSLQLLLNFVTSMGPVFTSRPSYTTAVHKYLCVSLLHNFTSHSAEVVKISSHILIRLLLEHRATMKSKVAVFFMNVLLPILESPNSSFAHRNAVLTLIEKYLGDGQASADAFVNFDCSVSSVNLYSQLVHRVARVVQSSHVTPNWITPQQDAQLKLQGIKTLTAHLSALRQWTFAQAEASTTERDTDGDGAVDDDNACRVTSEFERMLKDKKAFEAVVHAFNKKKAKEGIALALEHGLIRQETPDDIAHFLLQTKPLDKLKIGEYLAQNQPFIREVLKAFINSHDFTGLEIDEAMRVFLGKFKIFGEAEVVDRTMEMFAERYCLHNPTAFSSAGTAYILAFSIMMLNTDAHSVHVKSKMTLQEFIRNNRGIDDGRDLPEELVQNIYRRITTNEIKLDGDANTTTSEATSPNRAGSSSVGGSAAGTVSNAAAAASAPSSSHSDPHGPSITQSSSSAGSNQINNIFTSLEKKKQLHYKTETDQLKQQSMQLLSADGDETDFTAASGTEVAGAMWEAVWTPILPALSVPMEESDEEEMIDACLSGFDNAMSLNCHFAMSTERKAFISSLLAFTHLTSFREIHYKNVKSITTLIRIAAREGNGLESSWYEILRCISWLEKLHLLSGGSGKALGQNHGGSASLNAADSNASLSVLNRGGSVGSGSAPVSSRVAEQKKMELHNAEIVAATIDQVDVDRIFSKSGELEGRAVVDLVEALCKVSAEELQEQPRPRTYALQKLVEVAEINIGRLRYVWSQMWQHLSKHFVSVGLDKQQLVAMFVVDSLRQLAMKFLQRDELGNFNFQRDFLKPFEEIACQNKRPDILELIVASLGQMVEARAKNIMSGWKILLTTLGRCGSDPHASVVFAAAHVLERVTRQHLHFLATPDTLIEVVNAWSMFGANSVDSRLSIRAIAYVELVSVMVAHGVPTQASSESFWRNHETPSSHTTSTEGYRSSFAVGAALLSESTQAAVASYAAIIKAMSPSDVIPVRCSVPEPTATATAVTTSTPLSSDMKLWLSIFAALSSLEGVGDHATRARAMECLFDIIGANGSLYSTSDWQMILGGAVYPIFENMLCDIGSSSSDAAQLQILESGENESQMAQTLLLRAAMRRTTGLLITFSTAIASQAGDLLDTFLACSARGDNPTLVQLGFAMVQELVERFHEAGLADAGFWATVQKRLRDMGNRGCQAVYKVIMRPVGAEGSGYRAAQSSLTTIKGLCTCMTAIANGNDSVPPSVLHSFASVLRRIIEESTDHLDIPEGLDLATVRSLVAAEEAASVTYLELFPKIANDEEELAMFYESANKILSRVHPWTSSTTDGGNERQRQEESDTMASVVVAFLSMTVAEDFDEAAFNVMLASCFDALCTLVTICHPDVNHEISRVFLRAKSRLVQPRLSAAAPL